MSMLRDTGRDTVFFAVQPGPAAASRIQRFAMAERTRLGLVAQKLRLPRVLHVSLQGLGPYDHLSPTEIDWARRAAAKVAMPRFEVGFDRLFSFPNNKTEHPLVLGGGDGVVGLELLRNALCAALGLTEPGGYTPHMTLLYAPRVVDEILLDEPLKWAAEAFVLVRSLVGLSRYEILGRWPLMSRAQYLARSEPLSRIGDRAACRSSVRQL